jgi:hypothetical protein
MRNFARFYRAQEDFYRRLVRLTKYNPEAFAKAAGVPADTKVAGKPFFDLVKYYLDQQQKESVDERLDKRSLGGDTKSFRGTANRLPSNNTAGAKDITKKAKQADMPDGSYEIDFDNLDKEKLKKVVAKLIPTLGHEKNEMVLRARFGLEPFEKEYTLDQIAKAMGVTREVVRQREAKALRQLRHVSRSRELRPFLDDQNTEKNLDKFHNELDKLVHKYLGHSSDEKKVKKKKLTKVTSYN